MSIAVKTRSNKVFVETIDCREVRDGNSWIIKFLKKANVSSVVVDGASGQQLLADEMKNVRLKAPIMPTVKDIILANSSFEQGIYSQNIVHKGQPSVVQVVGNCEKRFIGSNGGFGYKSLREELEIAILDSIILAYWSCSTSKEKKKQRVSY